MKRYLALDIGGKRTGLALVNDESKVATPLMVISKEVKSAEFIHELLRQMNEYEIDILLVGLPIDLKGKESIAATNIRNLAASITSRINKNIEIIFVDERFSTAQAEKALKLADVSSKNRKNMRDAHAAMVIAQSYIDSI